MEENNRIIEPDVSLGETIKFYVYLQNDLKLSKKKSFEIIYYLQEYLRIIPDRYEKCSTCGDIFDTWSSGEYVESKKVFHCYYCIK